MSNDIAAPAPNARAEELAQTLKRVFCAGYLHAILTGARLRRCAEPAYIYKPKNRRRITRFSTPAQS